MSKFIQKLVTPMQSYQEENHMILTYRYDWMFTQKTMYKKGGKVYRACIEGDVSTFRKSGELGERRPPNISG